MAASSDYATQMVSLDSVFSVGKRRPIRDEAVAALMGSISRIGLRTPITVTIDKTITDPETGEEIGGYRVIVGAHRSEACRRLGWEQIPAIVRDCTPIDAELWEIAENLHRADLTALERDEQVARWVELSEQRISSQVATKMERGRPESGVNAAARELNIGKDDAHRAKKVAALSDEAKAAAREVGLDDNRTALLTAARAPVEQQAAVVRQYAERITVDADVQRDLAKMFAARLAEKFGPAEWDWVKSTLYALKAKVIADAFVNETGAGSPLMDRRYSA